MIFRKPRKGVYSIEELFHTIAGELKKHIEVVEYEVGSRGRILADVWRLRKLKADVYHITGDVHYFAPLLPREKTVLTVHDINHYLHVLRGLKRWLYKWLWVLWPIRSARVVTAISAKTKASLAAEPELGRELVEAKIQIIENCHSPLFKPEARQFNSACPVILHLGTAPHKNVPRLIEALEGIRCKLVVIGPLDETLRQQLDKHGIDYANPVNLSFEEVRQQYADCDILSFVSLAEGFGMPIIEAQAVGRPVITSNISPMRDVAGDGACLVDPTSVPAIRAGLERVIGDSAYRDRLTERGLANVRQYAPDAIACRYLDLYKRVVPT